MEDVYPVVVLGCQGGAGDWADRSGGTGQGRLKAQREADVISGGTAQTGKSFLIARRH